MNQSPTTALQRQIAQSSDDVRGKLVAAKIRKDVRRIDFFMGSLTAYKEILGVIEMVS